MPDIKTHKAVSERLCGKPLYAENGQARVELELIDEMTADDSGLVHGGFIFGLADYAAMLAVNHPNVVLGSAESKFLKPAKAGRMAVAEAVTESSSGRKHIVKTVVTVEGVTVYEGVMTCFVPDKHVLAE